MKKEDQKKALEKEIESRGFSIVIEISSNESRVVYGSNIDFKRFETIESWEIRNKRTW